jgi:hypothetical protein
MPGITAYARIAGVALLAVAAAIAVFFGWGAASIFYPAGLGLSFLYLGVSRLETAIVRQMIGGLGVLLVVVTAVAIVASWLLPMRYLRGPIELTGLIVGIASILAARYLPDRRSSRSS